MSERKRPCIRGHDTFLIGRDSSHRCLACKREAMYKARKAREAEEAAVRHAEREAMRAEEEQLRKAERARIIAAGGPDAKGLRWDERFRRTLQTTEVGLCQWAQPNGRPGGCFQRTELDGDLVYCAKHSRQLEIEAASSHQLKEVK
jgi:hypothetical protein